jgi:hypothetical protein
MSEEKGPKRARASFGEALPLALLCLALSPAALAQIVLDSAAQGDNAVWANSTTIQGTTATIDAAAWCNGDCTNVDFCQILNQALLDIQDHGLVFPQGGVVDVAGPPLRSL